MDWQKQMEMDFNRACRKTPASNASEAWIDFDGTLTKQDVVDSLVRGFCATDAWRKLEDAWQAGQIGSRDCLSGQFSLVRIGEEDLDAFLASVSLDPGTARLLNLLEQTGVPATILSDGIDWFIDYILRAHDLQPPPVRSNTLVRSGASWRLVCPHTAPTCPVAAAHCKCSSMDRLGHSRKHRIYIGDGRSDLCAARKAHLRFAKGALAANLDDEGLEYVPFATLHDVCHVLESAWPQRRSRAA